MKDEMLSFVEKVEKIKNEGINKQKLYIINVLDNYIQLRNYIQNIRLIYNAEYINEFLNDCCNEEEKKRVNDILYNTTFSDNENISFVLHNIDYASTSEINDFLKKTTDLSFAKNVLEGQQNYSNINKILKQIKLFRDSLIIPLNVFNAFVSDYKLTAKNGKTVDLQSEYIAQDFSLEGMKYNNENLEMLRRLISCIERVFLTPIN